MSRTFACWNHQNKPLALVQALIDAGWQPTTTPRCDLLLVDHCRAEPRNRLIDECADHGGTILVYPHGARPFVDYDGLIVPDARVAAHLVQSPGAADVLASFGFPLPVHVTGWHFNPVRPAVRPARIRTVLFAPAHPLGDGTLRDDRKQLNAAVFASLAAAARRRAWRLVVHLYADAERNGIPRIPGVAYVPSGLDGATNLLETADLVVAEGTYAYLAVAAGRPTLMFGQDVRPCDDAGERTVDSWEAYAGLLRYPLDMADGSADAMAELARAGTDQVADWRRRFIGQPFDAEAFATLVDRIVGAKQEAVHA